MATYEGEQIRVHFEGRRCIHARRCVLGLPGVFDPDAGRDWVSPDGADPQELAALIRQCPSGALTFEAKGDGLSEEATPAKNVVRVLEDGPLEVRADLHLTNEAPRTRAVLCRCGASKRKPYCDNSHREMGFDATGEPEPANDVVKLDDTGALEVQPATNGPLILRGPHEVVCGSGQVVKRGTKAALCRCGGSANKPFCDGTHARIGFEAE